MRIWRRRKRYALTVITLLTLVFIGLGTVLGILSTSVLRPVRVSRPDELFRVMADNGLDLWALDEFKRVTAAVPEVAQTAGMSPMERKDALLGGTAIRANIVTTTPNFFAMLGVTAAGAGTPGTAIVSSRLLNRLGLGAADVIGKRVIVGGSVLSITGVIDRSAAYPIDGEVWYADPLSGPQWFGLVRARGSVGLDDIANRLSRAYQQQYTGTEHVRAIVTSLVDSARPAMQGSQRMLMAGIAMFATIAILNYGLLGIGEARRRTREFAVRVAVGGTRAQVMRGLMLDQLALIAIALGLAAAVLAAVALRTYDMRELMTALVHLSPAIWGLLALSFALLLLCAALPARISSIAPEIEVLRQVNVRGSRFEAIWNRAFVGVQFGFASFLLIAAGIVLTGFLRDKNADYGFDASDAVVATVSLSEARQTPEQGTLVVRAFDDAVRRAYPPGAVTVWTNQNRPWNGQYKLAIEPGDLSKVKGLPLWMSQDVMPGFFGVMGIPIIRGRAFTAADNESAEPAIIVTAYAARSLWGTVDVVGRRIRFGEDDGTWRTVIGVAADAWPITSTAFSFRVAGMKWPMRYAYRSLLQTYPRYGFQIHNGLADAYQTGFSVIVRHQSLQNADSALQRLLDRVAPGEKFDHVESLSQRLDYRGYVEKGASTMRLLFAFSVCGLVLGLVGAMLLIDEVVRSRTTEFGIRRALGAPGASLIRLASAETLMAGVSGVLLGGLIGARFGPVASAWLKGSGKFMPLVGADWRMVAATIIGLAAVMAAGTFVRALRAAQLDPAIALRV
jgi:putative ABC transport system permease protein